MTAAALLAASAMLTMGFIQLLRPLLIQYALARPNARSSHTVPTPQGAGLAVIGAVLICVVAMWSLAAPRGGLAWPHIVSFVLAILGLAAIGFIDDVTPLPPKIRLAVQAACCLGLMLALPDGARALPFMPYPLEALISLIGLVWFVNLTNFMDGIDGMTVAGVVPVVVGIALFAASSGPTASMELVVALTLIGALLGFAPFNAHVARVFLGDVGSLAIGGIVAFLLLCLAGRGLLIPALILPLYYLADTTVTLVLRWSRGAAIGEAHREHFYQRAAGRGLGVPRVTAMVLALNGALLLMALLAAATALLWVQLACLAIAVMLTAAMLRYFRG